MRPNYHPEGLIDEKKVSNPQSNEGKSKPITQLWHLNGKCPEGTIPIRRTKKEDLLRTSSVQSYGKKKHGTIVKPARSADPDLISQSGHQVYTICARAQMFFYPTLPIPLFQSIFGRSRNVEYFT